MTNMQKPKITWNNLVSNANAHWKPKLVCLAIAIVVWLALDYMSKNTGDDQPWDDDKVRISLPN